MIAKVIPAKAGSREFGQLVDYVAAENRLEHPSGREFDDLVRYVGRENVVDHSTCEVIAKAVSIETQGVASLRTAAVEMEAVAAQCRRLRAPADYHLVFSWQEGEHPTPDQAFTAGRHALGALGMEAHQHVMAVHGDTANVHLHVAVNRVHPETYRAVSPFPRLHQAGSSAGNRTRTRVGARPGPDDRDRARRRARLQGADPRTWPQWGGADIE